MLSINLLARQCALTRILLAVSRTIMSVLRVASCALWLMSRLREYEERLDERNGWGGGVVTKYVWITVVWAQHHTCTTSQKGRYYINDKYSQTITMPEYGFPFKGWPCGWGLCGFRRICALCISDVRIYVLIFSESAWLLCSFMRTCAYICTFIFPIRIVYPDPI